MSSAGPIPEPGVVQHDVSGENDGEKVGGEAKKLSKGQKKRLQQKRAKARQEAAAESIASLGKGSEEVKGKGACFGERTVRLA